MLISCSNDDDNKNDAQVTVTVVSADGKPLPNEIVQMFDEKTYEEFKKDNRTTPTAYALTVFITIEQPKLIRNIRV